jgi:class 3 adenylate cyclase
VNEGKTFPFDLYNFTGDGWLLRFDYEIDGKKLLPFIQRLCAKYDDLYRDKILPLLETPPEVVGITIGMDRGRLIKIRMNNRNEYVGRPLNVACRLQSAIKDRDPRPANKMLMTKHLYNSIEDDVTPWKFQEAERTLRNIAGGRKLRCMKLLSIESRKN